jgi:hypothetical protein
MRISAVTSQFTQYLVSLVDCHFSLVPKAPFKKIIFPAPKPHLWRLFWCSRLSLFPSRKTRDIPSPLPKINFSPTSTLSTAHKPIRTWVYRSPTSATVSSHIWAVSNPVQTPHQVLVLCIIFSIPPGKRLRLPFFSLLTELRYPYFFHPNPESSAKTADPTSYLASLNIGSSRSTGGTL